MKSVLQPKALNYRPPHYAWILPQYRMGGAELTAGQLVELVRARGNRATYVGLERTDPRSAADAERIGVVDLAAGLTRFESQLSRLSRVVRLRRWLARERPDALVAFMPVAQAVALIAARPLRILVIISERTFPPMDRGTRHWRWLVSRLQSEAAGLVLLDESLRGFFPRIPDELIATISNPVTPAMVDPELKSGKWIVAVGRLVREKRFDRLLSAFAAIAARVPQWKLVIRGDGPERADLEGRVAGLGLQGRVLLPGATRTPRCWVPRDGIFSLTSDFEGFPNALAEAMAAGMPVVATDCPTGPRNMIRSGVDGVVVPMGNEEALSGALLTLAQDAQLRCTLGNNAAAAAVRWAPDRIVGAWIRTISHAVEAYRRSRR